MTRVHRDEPRDRRRPDGETCVPQARESAAPGLLELQRTAGNAAVGRLLQRTHPAFNEVNYWSTPLPSLESVEAELAGNRGTAGGGRPIPRPGSPEAVIARLRGKFQEEIAQLLLGTEADGQDALDREPMTADFLADGGKPADAVELLTAHPRDNTALAAAYLQRQRDNLTSEFLGEGGTRAKATQREAEEPTVRGLREAYHGDLLGDLSARANAATARVDALLAARASMSHGARGVKPPEAVIQLRFDMIEAKRAAREPGAAGRARWLALIQRAEQWAGTREAVTATIPAQVREIMQDTDPRLYSEPGVVITRLFDEDPFDLTSYNQAYANWIAQPPVRRLALQTPQQAIDGLVMRVRNLWALSDAVGRPIGTQLYSAAGGPEALTLLENNAVPKATWDSLMATLTLGQTIEAIRRLQTAPALAELVWRLTHRDYSAANLSAVALNPPPRATIHRGRCFLYKGSTPHSIETEISITWLTDIWMPSGMNHWGEVHIHYTGRTALQANITYVHLKLDRAIPGGTAIPTNHAIIAHAYNTGLIDPNWTV
jgi:hypothetical protein